MAFVFLQKENIYVVYGDTIVVSNSSQEPKVFKNPELTAVTDKTQNHELQPEAKEEEEISSPAVQIVEKSDSLPESPEADSLQKKLSNDKEHECEEEDLETSVKPVDTKQVLPANNRIVCCCLSLCGRLLAVADHAKRLIIWQCNENQEWHVISCRTTKRKCIRLNFCPSSQVVLAADRAGDVYSFSFLNPLEPEKLLLGHLSMLLDMLVSNDGKFVITSDRDEKIRVTRYPNTYNIQSYCLGHTEFVSALSLCGSHSDWLLSGSGDGTLRLWNYKLGKELHLHSYESDIQPVLYSGGDTEKDKRIPAATQIEMSEESHLVAVLFDKLPCVGLYQINTGSDLPTLTHTQLVPTSVEPWDIKLSTTATCLFILSSEDILTVLHASKDRQQFVKPSRDEESEAVTKINSLLNNQLDCLKDYTKREDFQHLYKQWFDNMKTYLEKKELREKNKQTKGKKKFKKLNSVN